MHHAKFIKRYKRFFADVRIDGGTLVAHVANTGSLKTCLYEGAPCLITLTDDPSRKLKASLQFLSTPTGWAGVNTSLPNQLVHEAWTTGLIPEWREFKHARREFKISKESRIDLVLARDKDSLTNKKPHHYIEVKNVTYAEGDTAYFPDAATERGRKHLRELMRLREEGFGAELVFVVQREGCKKFRPADAIDAKYGRLLREARTAGVMIRALPCAIDPADGVTLLGESLVLDF